LRLKALFLGLPRARVKRVISSIEAASAISIGATMCDDPGEKLGELVCGSDAVFINRHLDGTRLERSLSEIREHRDDVPVTLIYESEPNGEAFLFATRYDCWLFSEMDRLGRTLSPAEVGEALLRKRSRGETERRLMEISLCTGPCSTGD
jgi:hypothetical protein